MEYRPPLVPPADEGQRKIRQPAPFWTRTWCTVFCVLGGLCTFPPRFSTIFYFTTGDSTPDWFVMGLTCLLVTVLTVGFWFVLAMIPKWWTTRKWSAPPILVGWALRYHAKIGAEGKRRTSRLITEPVLPSVPAARLIDGLRWPGSEHADIDHAVIAGNRIALIDSKMWGGRRLLVR